MNKSYWWWLQRPLLWSRFVQRNRLREVLALKLMLFLSKDEQGTDDIGPSKNIVDLVLALEQGKEMSAELTAIWLRARAEPAVVQLANDLHEVSNGNELPVSSQLRSRDLRQQREHTLQKIEFKSVSWVAHLPVLIPIVSAFSLISGYVYTAIFFSGFNLSVSNYFGLSDYISASMDGLVVTMLAAVFGHLMMLMQSKRQRLSALQRRLFVNNWGTIFGLMVVVICLVVFSITQEREAFRTIVIYSILISVGTSVAPFIAAYSRRPSATLLLCNFFVIYVALMWFLTNVKVQQLLRPAKFATTIELNDEAATKITQRIVAGNSLYLFLLNDAHEISVLPIENIKQIHYSPKPSEKAKP